MFSVAKDEARDRLVLDARPANQLEDFPGRWVHSLASASALSGIILQPGEVLLMSGTDLSDCFYQFVAGPQRCLRNLLKGSLSPDEAASVFGYDCMHALQPDGSVAVGLSSLAMGDSSACEDAQSAHLGVLLQGRAIFPGELLVYAAPPPRSLLTVGLVMDDLVYLHRACADNFPPDEPSGGDRLEAALNSYRAAPLNFNDKKTFFNREQASFWGVDCCGRSGLVRTIPARLWPLTLITLRVVQLGLASRALLESLLGSELLSLWLGWPVPGDGLA